MAKERYVRTLEPYFAKRAEEPFWSYSHPQNLLQNGDFEAWTAGSGVGDEPDGWTESGVGDVQREAGWAVKRCTYSALLTHPGGAGGSTLYQIASCAQFYRGLYVSLSAWVYADDADRVRLSLADGVTSTYSEYHPGDGAWWLLTVVKLMDGVANQVTTAFRIEAGAGAVTARIDAAHLCLGPVPRGFANKPLYDDGTVTIEDGIITKNVQAGDPRQVYSIGGVAKAVTGVDDDDGDKFKVAIGTSVLGTAADVLFITTANDVGIGVTPLVRLHVLDTAEQLRLAYNADSFVSFTVAADSDLLIKPAETGQVIIQPTTDSTTFFQILDADGGIPILNVDALNEYVGFGTAAPGARVDVVGVVRGDDYFHIRKDKPAATGMNRIFWQTDAAVGVEYWALETWGYGAGSVASLVLRTGHTGDYVLIQPGGGRAAVGTIGPLATFHIDQAAVARAIPVLYLDQADVSEEMIEFNTTIAIGNPIEAIGAKTLTPTHFIRVTLPGALSRYFQVGTIA